MNRVLSGGLLVTLMLLSVPAITSAQETLVPLDSAGSLDRIDAELDSRLGLFADTPGFQEASMYRTSDTSYVLEITYVNAGVQQRQRRPLTSDEAARFRQTVSDRINIRAPQTMLDQEGRALFITGTTALGLGYYGPAMIAGTDADGRMAVAVYMLTAATGFFVPYVATQNAQVTMSQARLGVYGFAAGALHGHLLYGLFSNNDFTDDNASFLVSVAAGLAEGCAGYALAGSNHLAEGKTTVITSIGTFGLGIGAGAGYLLGADTWGAYSASILAGTAAGFFAGNTIANMQDYSSGDASVMSTVGVVGAYVPLGILLMTDLDDGKVYAASAMAGAIGGIALGHHLVSGHQFTDAQGNYVALGTLASTAVAVGAAYLIGSDNADEKMFAGAALVGSVGGVALMYSLLEDDARDTRMGSGLRFDISPAAIGAYAMGRRPRGNHALYLPMAGVTYQF